MAKTKQTTPLVSGPWAGVYNTRDPWDARQEYAVDAVNCFVANPSAPAEFFGRPGFRRLNNGEPIYAPAGPFRGQLVYSHTMLDGTILNFAVIAGHLFRADSSLDVWTDVTPVGITIDDSVVTRVFGVSLIGQLAFTDGVNRPWIATDLENTPITGTYIDYDGMGVAWNSYGAPKVYNGAVFMILNEVNGVSRRVDISWSQAGIIANGWQQPDFDNNWTLSQNEAGLLFSLESDNTALRYFRDLSIGAASGSSVLDLASTATDDALAFNIGTQSPQSIQKFGNGFFFIDAQGRPYWYQPGIAPEPIWKQMRTSVETGSTTFPEVTSIVSTAVIEPTLNQYWVAIWSPSPISLVSPFTVHVFDAITRIYQGRYIIGTPEINGIDSLGVCFDEQGRATIVALTNGGYAWGFNAITTLIPENLVTPDEDLMVTPDGVQMVTPGQIANWTDDGDMVQFVQTDRLGYSEDVNCNVDSATIVTLAPLAFLDTDTKPLNVSIITSQEIAFEGTVTNNLTHDGTRRYFMGCDVFGRGPSVIVAPADFEEQFTLSKVTIKAALSKSGPEDQ